MVNCWVHRYGNDKAFLDVCTHIIGHEMSFIPHTKTNQKMKTKKKKIAMRTNQTSTGINQATSVWWKFVETLPNPTI